MSGLVTKPPPIKTGVAIKEEAIYDEERSDPPAYLARLSHGNLEL